MEALWTSDIAQRNCTGLRTGHFSYVALAGRVLSMQAHRKMVAASLAVGKYSRLQFPIAWNGAKKPNQ